MPTTSTPNPDADSSKPKYVAADWDKGTQWIVNAHGHKTARFSKESFLNGFAFRDHPETVFIIEASHLQERLKRSVAQIYTRSELEELYRQAEKYDVTILAFPQKMTPRAREEFGVEKAEDAYAIRQFVLRHPEIGLMRAYIPTVDDKIVWDRRTEMRKEMSERLNVMRPLYDHAEVEQAQSRLHQMYHTLKPETIEWFGLRLVFAGKPNERLEANWTRVMSVYVACFEPDGKLRTNDQGTFIGVREALALLWMNPYHGRGGTARSNLILHALSKSETRFAGQRARVPELRRSFIKAIKQLIQAFRDSQ